MKNNNKLKIPKKIIDEFVHSNIYFEISSFEEMMLNDIYQSDEQTKIKLNRNVTKEFNNEFNLYHKQKRNIRYNIKGETRDGKSYVGLKIMDMSLDKQNLNFNEKSSYYTCGNQIEYRKKLQIAKFGEFYLIDENFFIRAGLGANIEMSQLTDYNNIIAKMNIGNVFITPQKFLNTGAVLGFSTYGRDSKNWLTRCLLFKFKDGYPYLIGYVVFDIGSLFLKHGCLLFKCIGGCTNPNRIELDKINKDLIKYSDCIPEQYKDPLSKMKVDRNDDKSIINCPFYNVCIHGICKYEKKKDSWIVKEMKGGLDERTYERFKLACELILDLDPEIISEKNLIKLNAKNGKDLKNRVRLKIHKFSNVKLGIAEFDELLEIIKSNTDISLLCDTLLQLENKYLLKKYLEMDKDNIILNVLTSLKNAKKSIKK